MSRKYSTLVCFLRYDDQYLKFSCRLLREYYRRNETNWHGGDVCPEDDFACKIHSSMISRRDTKIPPQLEKISIWPPKSWVPPPSGKSERATSGPGRALLLGGCNHSNTCQARARHGITMQEAPLQGPHPWCVANCSRSNIGKSLACKSKPARKLASQIVLWPFANLPAHSGSSPSGRSDVKICTRIAYFYVYIVLYNVFTPFFWNKNELNYSHQMLWDSRESFPSKKFRFLNLTRSKLLYCTACPSGLEATFSVAGHVSKKTYGACIVKFFRGVYLQAAN